MSNQKNNLQGHLLMLTAATMWGMMAPFGKEAMANGIGGLNMVALRVSGAALLFWLTSLLSQFFSHQNEENELAPINGKELAWLFGAGMFAIVCNQCNYIIGLSITSPLNASIMTTTMPIITMVFAALILKERITSRKVLGLILGCMGALAIILSSAGGAREGGVLLGDLMCIAAQTSYAFYLTRFKGVISRHSAITCQKWMMLFATLVILPFAMPSLMAVPWSELSVKTCLETAFVVVGGTFFSFLCCTKAQRILSPTVIAMYNYVQPIVACTLSVLLGLGIFGWSHIIAIILVFSGVYLVTHNKKLLILLIFFFSLNLQAEDNVVMKFDFSRVSSKNVSDELSGITAKLMGSAKVEQMGTYTVLNLGASNGYLDLTAAAGGARIIQFILQTYLSVGIY